MQVLTNDVPQPLWVLKTAKEKRVQRLVHISTDLARHVGTVLENVQSDLSVEVNILLSSYLFSWSSKFLTSMKDLISCIWKGFA